MATPAPEGAGQHGGLDLLEPAGGQAAARRDRSSASVRKPSLPRFTPRRGCQGRGAGGGSTAPSPRSGRRRPGPAGGRRAPQARLTGAGRATAAFTQTAISPRTGCGGGCCILGGFFSFSGKKGSLSRRGCLPSGVGLWFRGGNQARGRSGSHRRSWGAPVKPGWKRRGGFRPKWPGPHQAQSSWWDPWPAPKAWSDPRADWHWRWPAPRFCPDTD